MPFKYPVINELTLTRDEVPFDVNFKKERDLIRRLPENTAPPYSGRPGDIKLLRDVLPHTSSGVRIERVWLNPDGTVTVDRRVVLAFLSFAKSIGWQCAANLTYAVNCRGGSSLHDELTFAEAGLDCTNHRFSELIALPGSCVRIKSGQRATVCPSARVVAEPGADVQLCRGVVAIAQTHATVVGWKTSILRVHEDMPPPFVKEWPDPKWVDVVAEGNSIIRTTYGSVVYVVQTTAVVDM